MRWHLCKCFQFSWVRSHSMLGITPLKNGTDVHLKWHLSLLNFRFTCMHICNIPFIVCCPGLCHHCHYLQPEYHLQCQIHLVKLLIFSFIFHSNISPAGAASNSNLLYLYLPNWHANVVRYDYLLSSLRL